MVDKRITPIVAALQGGQRDHFEALVVEFLNLNSPDALWAALGAAHGESFNLFEQLSAWPTTNIRVAMRRLMPAVQHVRAIALRDCVQFLEFAERVPGSFRYSVSEQLRPHVAASPELGRQIGNALRAGEVVGEEATRVWARAFASAVPGEAAEYALELLTTFGGDVALLAVLLQFLPANSAEVVAVLQPVESRLADALLGVAHTHGKGNDAWAALTAIAGYSPSAMNALQRAVEAGDATALVAVAHCLQTISSPIVGTTPVPVQKLVKAMFRHAVENAEVRSAVDSAAASLIHGELTRKLVVPCVTELGTIDEDVVELFPEMFGAICEQQQDFTKLLTGWLLATGVTFTAIRSLLSRCAVDQAPADLDGEMFGAAHPDRKVAAARRLLGLTHNGPVLCRFIASLAESPTVQPHDLELAAQMLNEAFIKYPSATEEFLKSRTRPAERTKPFSDVYRGIYASAVRWRRVLARLPKLNELRPTDSQLYALRAMHIRVNREIMRAAEQRSIFATLVTNMHLAQGQRFASHTAHGPPQVAEMQSVSHSVELPSSELADPVGGMLRRARTLGASR